MNALEKFAQKAYGRIEEDCSKRTLALAYLQLHWENLALHPDDYLDPESGYGGWHVILMHQAWTKFAGAPDEFRYPGYQLQLQHALNLLAEFHADDDEEAELLDLVRLIQDYMENMTEAGLQDCIDAIDRLNMYHADGPDEVFTPMYSAFEVLCWISQFN